LEWKRNSYELPVTGDFLNYPDQYAKNEPMDHLRQIKFIGVDVKNNKEDQAGI
jgi:hypothetical protein